MKLATTVLLALWSSALLVVSFEVPTGFLLTLVSLTPVALAARDASRAQAFALGMLAWAPAAIFEYRQTPQALSAFGGVPLGWGCALVVGQACLEAARVGAAVAALTGPSPSPLTAALLLAAAETLLPSLSGACLGVPLVRSAGLAPLAALGGGALLSAVAAACSFSVASALSGLSAAPLRVAGRFVLGALAAGWMTSWLTPGRASLQRTEALRVAVAQTDVRPGEPSLPPLALARRARAEGAELLVLPEGSLGEVSEPARASTALARELDWQGPLLSTGTLLHGGHARTTVALTARGALLGSSEKALPMPFAEAAVAGLLASTTRALQPGSARVLVLPASRDLRLGAHVCYEILSSAAVRERVRSERPDLLAVPTNDGWLPDAGELHVLIARLRAAEHGLSVALANTTGPSVLIGASGQELARVGPGQRGVATVDLAVGGGETPFTAAGSWWSLLAATGALAWRGRGRRAASW